MALRWYSTVVDCRNVSAQARWWAEAIGWEQIGPGLVFVPVPEDKTVKNRLHIDLAPHTGDDRAAEIGRLVALGATRADAGTDGQPVISTHSQYRPMASAAAAT